jgi:hypothetical protein
MARHPFLWSLVVLAVVAALFVWTPMSLAPAAALLLVFLPFVLLAGFGVYHMVHGALQRRPGRTG